jgi:type II secretory pathway component PulF
LLSRNGSDTAAEVSEIMANIAMTVIGLVILFVILSMIQVLCCLFEVEYFYI